MENLPEGSLFIIAIIAFSLLFLAIVGRNILNRVPEEDEPEELDAEESVETDEGDSEE